MGLEGFLGVGGGKIWTKIMRLLVLPLLCGAFTTGAPDFPTLMTLDPELHEFSVLWPPKGGPTGTETAAPADAWVDRPSVCSIWQHGADLQQVSAGVATILRAFAPSNTLIDPRPTPARLPSAPGLHAAHGFAEPNSAEDTELWCLSRVDLHTDGPLQASRYRRDGPRWEQSHDVKNTCSLSEPESHFVLASSSSVVKGAGLHPAVKFMWNVAAAGTGGHFDTMVLLHLPQEAYVDLDEISRRHDFQLTVQCDSAWIPDAGLSRVSVASGSMNIDVELPAHVSAQHAVALSWTSTCPPFTAGSALKVSASIVVPLHVRYQRPLLKKPQDGFTGAIISPPLIFTRGHSSSEDGGKWELLRRHKDHPPLAPTLLPFPTGEGFLAAFVPYSTALVHLAGLIFVAWSIVAGSSNRMTS